MPLYDPSTRALQRAVLLCGALLISPVTGVYGQTTDPVLYSDKPSQELDIPSQDWPLGYVEFSVEEGTWTNLDISPDGSTIVFDLLGQIYTLPAEGGAARPLRRDRSWYTAPKFSTDGKEILFVADLAGEGRGLWALSTVDGAARNIMPPGPHDRDVVRFSLIADTSDYVIEWKGAIEPGDSRLQFTGGSPGTSRWAGTETDRATGIISGDVQGSVIFAQPRLELSASAYSDFDIHRYIVATRQKEKLVENGFGPALSPDRMKLAFFRMAGPKTELWLRNLATGVERKLLADSGQARLSDRMSWQVQTSQGLIPSIAFGPNSDSIYTGATGKILKINIETGNVFNVPFVAQVQRAIVQPIKSAVAIRAEFDAKQVRWFTATRSNRVSAFFAAGGLWVGDLESGTARQIAHGESRQFAPSLSPDGKRLAYTRWLENGGSELKILEFAKGGLARVVARTGGIFGQPTWSPNGRSLAVQQFDDGKCEKVQGHHLSPEKCEIRDLETGSGLETILEFDIAGGNRRTLLSRPTPAATLTPKYVANSSLIYTANGQKLRFIRPSEGVTNFSVVSLDRNDGSQEILTEIEGTKGVDFVAPSPDGSYIAFGANEQTWIQRIEPSQAGMVKLNFEHPDAGLRSIGLAGSAAFWSGPKTLIWNVGSRVFRWQPDFNHGDEVAVIRATVPNPAPKRILAITNATILPMDTDRIIERGTILIDGARILAVGARDDIQVPTEAIVIDARGKTVLPGFVDTHAHPHSPSCCERGYPRETYKPYQAALAWGVTTIFDPQAGNEIDAFTQAEMVASGAMTGPRVFSAGSGIFGSHLPHGENVFLRDGGANAACAIVRRRVLNGAIMVKSYLIGSRELRKKIVECARAYGVGATTEGGPDANLQLTHYMDGYSATEHYLLPAKLGDDVVQYVARTGIFYTPVTTALANGQEAIRYFGSRDAFRDDERIRNFLPEDIHSYAEASGYQADNIQSIYDLSRSAQKVIAAGGKLALGSHGQFDGIGLHHDMWMLQLGGIAPFDLLRAGTIWGAEKLGLSRDLGTIEAGKLADLAILDCNPLGDIRCTARTHYVVKSGFVYDPRSLSLIPLEAAEVKQPVVSGAPHQ